MQLQENDYNFHINLQTVLMRVLSTLIGAVKLNHSIEESRYDRTNKSRP